MFQQTAVTSTQMWLAAGIVAGADIIVVGTLVRFVLQEAFLRLRMWFPSVAAVTWALIYGLAALTAWDACYRWVMPAWVRWGAWLHGLGHVLLGIVFWWVARRTRVHPAVTLAVLGGLHSLPGHLHGIYGRGLLEHCPLVHGVSAASALVFGVFEFAFYWMVVLVISLGLQRLVARLKSPGESPGITPSEA